jgi:type I restriction-modification system DNA methylase subunit
MSQATLSGTYHNSNLFSNYYLDERVYDLGAWDCDEAAAEALEELRELWAVEGRGVEAYNEDTLLDQWIEAVLSTLGFQTLSETALPTSGGFVDRTLFGSAEDRIDAAALQDAGDLSAMYGRSLAVLEAKQWDADFEKRFHEDRQYRDASHQIKYYLERTPDAVQWGILTDGRKWRLYGTKDYETQTYYEVDLPELLERGNLEAFKRFFVFFRAEAFRETAGTTLLDTVWSESEAAAEDLGEDLQDNVFTALRVLGRGFVETNDLDIDPDDDAALAELKEQSLVLLYRLMFVLYAEARGLIDPDDPGARDEYRENFSLDQIRRDVFEAIDGGDAAEGGEAFDLAFSRYSTALWSRLEDLFRLVDAGNDDLDIPPYNGGLFDREEHAFLVEHEVADRYVAEVVYRVSTTESEQTGETVLADYADLDTRHLGSIYEGLLEHQFRIAGEDLAAVREDGGQAWKPAAEVSVADAVETVDRGGFYVVNDEGERKATGAYYTPDYVVTYIVEETVDPLLEEIHDDLAERGIERGTPKYFALFRDRVTDLKILDPAMGSGHFLTKATGYLADAVMAEARELETGGMYDEQRIRRDVSKECIYGVDLNPMAVELAKLSMWLETLAADQPLAFLDHHLKCGNSLVGSDIEEIEGLESDQNGDEGQYSLAEFGATREGTIERLMEIYQEFLAIENEDLDDVKAMERKYAQIQEDDLRRRLVAMANVRTAEDFGLDVSTEGDRNPYEWMASALESDADWAEVEERDWFTSAQAMAEEENFFHWRLEFPETFYRISGELDDDSGFDAIIGNPPYGALFTKPQQVYLDVKYSVRGIEYDSYLFFIEIGLSLLRDEGGLGYIVPTVWTKLENNRSLREFILEKTRVRKLVDCGKIFKSNNKRLVVDTLMIVAQKTDLDGDIDIRVVEDADSAENQMTNLENHIWSRSYQISQEKFKQNDGIRINYDTYDPVQTELIKRIQNQSTNLENISTIGQGVTAYDRRAGQSDEIVENRAYHSGKKEDETYGKWLSGSDIGRYELCWSGEWLSYGDWLVFPRKRELFTHPRLLFREVTGGLDRVIATYTEDEYYYGHSIIPAVVSESILDNYCMLSIMNSKIVSYYHLSESPNAQKDIFPKMNPSDVENLPVFSDVPEQQEEELSKLGSQMLTLKREQRSINLHLPDYLGTYAEGPTLADLPSTPPAGLAESLLTATESGTDRFETIRATEVEITRDGDRLTLSPVPYVKPVESVREEYDTNSHGYATLDPIPAMTFHDLDPAQAALIEAFVPHAVEEAGGYAGFRDGATKTISLLDRLESLTLPALDDVRDGIEDYRDAVERAEELDEKIERTDALIDEIVYELYGLTDEEIEIVEEAVGE